MNKKMETLYAELNTLFRWVDTLKAEHDADPEVFTDSDLVTKIGMRIIDISEELDITRKEYQSQPLWKRLLKR